MPSEDITREQYLASGSLRGNPFGDFEVLSLGATYVSELVTTGVTALVPAAIDYPFERYKPPKKPGAAKPDRVYVRREGDRLLPVAAEEWKQANKLTTAAHHQEAGEQALFAALALGVHIGVVSGGTATKYVDVQALLHLAEAVRSPATSTAGLNAALADTFALMNENETLGSLLNPPRDAVDVILTNPPYVTQGSAIYRSELKDVKGARNGVDLREYYEGSGLGVESLFLRYISGALKPGGRAFVIVPLGLLNRTETGPKANLLRECNLLGSIQLPRNAFFNTAQPTYILVLEKRHTSVDERPPVFCGIARSTGETLDYERVPTPDVNDLMDIAELFIEHLAGNHVDSPVVRVAPPSEFTENERWDVPRFWTDSDLVDLGERAPAVPRLTFIEELTSTLATLQEDLAAAHEEFRALTSGLTVEIPLSDDTLVKVRSGSRVTNAQVREHPGDIPVYSCFTDAKRVKGCVDADWLAEQKIPLLDAPSATVNANGASGVGIVFTREAGCLLTDDVIAVTPVHPYIDVDYLAVALASSVAAGGYLYEAKLFVRRVRALSVRLPTRDDGSYDIEQQRLIAAAAKRLDTIRQRLTELGKYSRSARIS